MGEIRDQFLPILLKIRKVKGGKFGGDDERSVSALHLGNNRERYSRRLSRHGMGRID